nr:homolog of EHV2 ORF49 tegument protein G49 [Macronycteris gammaherpesvirus 1]
MEEKASFRIPKKTVINTFHDYYMPSSANVLAEFKEIQVNDIKNPKFSVPKSHLEKAVYLLKVWEKLLKNKNEQQYILQAIQENIQYFVRYLSKVTKSKDLVEELTRKSKSSEFGPVLLQIRRRKYPSYKLHDTSTEDPETKSPALWCCYHMTRICDPVNRIRDSLLPGDGVYSLSKFTAISMSLLSQDFEFGECPDSKFNCPYNLVVFWVAVLKKFEAVFKNGDLEDDITVFHSLIKDEVNKCVSCILDGGLCHSARVATLMKTINFLQWKLERGDPSEILSILLNLKRSYLIR